MTNHVLLDNVLHKDLTVNRHYSAEYGHNVGAVQTFSTEWADILREYPIMIQKDPAASRYRAIAMLGLSPDENLFLTAEGQGWNASYIPAMLAKGPFLIGFEDQTSSGGRPDAPVVHVDLDDPRVNAGNGLPVFMPHGGQTEHLSSVSNVLNGIRHGASTDEKMFAMFDKLGLIEPLALEVSLAGGEELRIEGHHAINQDRLSSLTGNELAVLNHAGFLQGAFMIICSLGNIDRLIALKNMQTAAE